MTSKMGVTNVEEVLALLRGVLLERSDNESSPLTKQLGSAA